MAGDSKTEKATPKKRRDERKKGNVLKSQDIVVVLGTFASFFALKLYFPTMVKTLRYDMQFFVSLSGSAEELTLGDLQKVGIHLMISGAKLILPLALISVAVAIIATGAQTRFLFVAKNFYPKFSNINPIEGIRKLFALRNLIELLKNIIKIIILIYILYGLLKDDMASIIKTMNMDISASVNYMMELMMSMIFRVTLVFVVVAAADFLYQWWDYERRLKMSKQEVKEEFKQMEGNPEVKGKIRQIQRQRAQMRMMQAVPNADVIVRNPTHFAVALQYDAEKHSAPIVVAKGQDEVALRIVAIGEENKVMVVENKPLARGLYASTEINQEIPAEYYNLVAELLVEVYKINNRKVK